MNDFETIVYWLFAQLDKVLSLISLHWVLRYALFIPIAGGAMLAVFYLLQNADFFSIFQGKERGSRFSGYAFGSAVSKMKYGAFGASSLNSMGIDANGLSVVKASRSLFNKKRKAKHQALSEEKKRREALEREAERERQQNLYRKNERVYADSNGEIHTSVSYTRSTPLTDYDNSKFTHFLDN